MMLNRCLVVGKLTGFLLSHTVSFMAWSPACVHLVHLCLSQSHLSRCSLASGMCTGNTCNGMYRYLNYAQSHHMGVEFISEYYIPNLTIVFS